MGLPATKEKIRRDSILPAGVEGGSRREITAAMESLKRRRAIHGDRVANRRLQQVQTTGRVDESRNGKLSMQYSIPVKPDENSKCVAAKTGLSRRGQVSSVSSISRGVCFASR